MRARRFFGSVRYRLMFLLLFLHKGKNDSNNPFLLSISRNLVHSNSAKLYDTITYCMCT